MLNIYRQQNQLDDEPQAAHAAAPPKPEAHSDYKKFVDATGEFNSKELGYGIWYVEHRLLLYRIILTALIVVSVMLWAYSLIRWAAFFINWQRDSQVQSQLAKAPDYTLLANHFAPTQLQVLSTVLLPGGVDKYDAVADVANTNDDFSARLTYHFVVNGVPTTQQTTVLLPGENRPVVALGLSNVDSASDVVFQVDAAGWQRVNPHQVANPDEWQADRLRFEVSSTSIRTGQSTSDGLRVNKITFDLTNNSSYGYIQPNFYVGLYEGDALVGVMPLTLADFPSLKTVPVDLRNFVGNLNASDVKVFPLINLYDRSVYLTPAP